MQKPKCKCGNDCAYYGEVGGFSVACKDCNAKNAERQRRNRAIRRLKDHLGKWDAELFGNH